MSLHERSLRMAHRSLMRAVTISCAVVLFACMTRAQASELNLSIVLTKDTFLPFEPITGTVFVTNRSERTISIPDAGRYVANAFRSSVTTAAGEVLTPGIGGAHLNAPGQPTWEQYQLAPGEVLSTGLYDLAQGIGRQGPAPSYAELEPGRYSVVVKWDPRMETYTLEWTTDSSSAVSFTVRDPHSDEAPVLALYRAALSCLDTSVLSEQRLGLAEHYARAALRCRAPEPYAILAWFVLHDVYWERLNGFGKRSVKSELTQAWADSLHFIHRDIIISYPNSPIAAAWFSQMKFEFNDLALYYLANTFPDAYVGREATRLLKQQEHSSRSK